LYWNIVPHCGTSNQPLLARLRVLGVIGSGRKIVGSLSAAPDFFRKGRERLTLPKPTEGSA